MKPKIIIICVAIAAILIYLLAGSKSGIVAKENKDEEGSYVCVKAMDVKTDSEIGVIPMKIVLKNGFAQISNKETGADAIDPKLKTPVSYEYNRKSPRRSTKNMGDEINIIIPGSTTRPSIYFKNKKLYYMRYNKVISQLFIFVKEKK